eukprot:15355610-Ditylum_brightwellii.AAC.1
MSSKEKEGSEKENTLPSKQRKGNKHLNEKRNTEGDTKSSHHSKYTTLTNLESEIESDLSFKGSSEEMNPLQKTYHTFFTNSDKGNGSKEIKETESLESNFSNLSKSTSIIEDMDDDETRKEQDEESKKSNTTNFTGMDTDMEEESESEEEESEKKQMMDFGEGKEL